MRQQVQSHRGAGGQGSDAAVEKNDRDSRALTGRDCQDKQFWENLGAKEPL